MASCDESSVLAKTVAFDDEQSCTPSAITTTTYETKLYSDISDRSVVKAAQNKINNNGVVYSLMEPVATNMNTKLDRNDNNKDLLSETALDECTIVTEKSGTESSYVHTTNSAYDEPSFDGTKKYSIISDRSVIHASEQMFAVSKTPQRQYYNNCAPTVLETVEDQIIATPEITTETTPAEAARLTKHHNKKCWIISFSFMLAILGFAGSITLFMVLQKNNDDPTNVTPHTYEERLSTLITFLSPYYDAANVTNIFSNITSAQYQAVKWVLDTSDSIDTASSSGISLLLQRYALAVLYFTTNGTEWLRNASFLSNQHVCYWNETLYDDNNNSDTSSTSITGVTSCTDDGRITAISLGNNNLQGSIPYEIGMISSLQSLFLQNNSLTGTIPSSIESLPRLQLFWAFDNVLTGSVPLFASSTKNGTSNTMLNSLDLSVNNLTGTLPRDYFTRLQNLTLLHLYSNQLNGTIPEFTSQNRRINKRLNNLALSENNFYGTLPKSIGDLSQLQFLYLFDNKFTGTVPSSFSKLMSIGKYSLFRFTSTCLLVASIFVSDNFNMPLLC